MEEQPSMPDTEQESRPVAVEPIAQEERPSAAEENQNNGEVNNETGC